MKPMPKNRFKGNKLFFTSSSLFSRVFAGSAGFLLVGETGLGLSHDNHSINSASLAIPRQIIPHRSKNRLYLTMVDGLFRPMKLLLIN